MRNRSLKKNAALNVIKSALSVIFPLITYPYAFRILGASNIGKVDYSLSIVSYFTSIAALGVSSYAVRECSKVRDNRKEINTLASQLFTINVFSTLAAYLALFVIVLAVPKFHPYSVLIGILSISIIFTTLGIDWINTVYEDFLFITLRSIAAHIISLFLLFIIVRNKGDYYQYAILSVLNNVIIGISNWIYCRRYVKIRLTKNTNIKKHLSPILFLFANNIATSIYVSSDTTMLGWMSGDYYVGIYSIAVKIYNVVKNIIVAIYSVAIPRISYYIGQKDFDSLEKTYTKIFSSVTLILIPAAAGIIGISPEIIMFMGGEEYTESVITLQILSIALVGAIFGGMVTYALNIPLGREKVNFKATIISAVINVGLNVVLIPILKQNGAAITTAISEFFVFFFCVSKFDSITEYIDTRMLRKNIIDAVVGAISIILIAVMIHHTDLHFMIRLLIIFMLSCFTYLVELILLKNNIALEEVQKIRSRFRR